MVAFEKASLLDLLPIEQAFSDLPRFDLTEQQATLLGYGLKIELGGLYGADVNTPLLQLFLNGLFLGLGRIEKGVLIRERLIK